MTSSILRKTPFDLGLFALLVACGSGNSAPGSDAAADAPEASVPDAPEPGIDGLCPSEPAELPADFARGCSAGSNRALCLMAGGDRCESKLCLFDGADRPLTTYCTAACKVGDANACPRGYVCRQDECRRESVCVLDRSAAPVKPWSVSHDGAPSERIVAGVADPTLGLVVQTGRGSVFRRRPEGRWESVAIEVGPNGGAIGLRRFGDAVLVAGTELDRRGGALWIARVGAAGATRATLAIDDPAGWWALFETAAGRPRLYKGSPQGAEIYDVDPATAAVTRVSPPAGGLAIQRPFALTKFGVAGGCASSNAICVSDDGLSVRAVRAPGTLAGSDLRIAGWDPRDLFAHVGADLLHLDGERLAPQNAARARTSGSMRVVALGPREAIVLAGTALSRARGGCWSNLLLRQDDRLPLDDADLPIALDARTVTWIHEGKTVVVRDDW
jgi:hypothetical protein